MKNFKKITLGVLGAVLLTTGLYSCSNDSETVGITQSEKVTLNAKDSGLKYEVETMNFVNEFYNGKYSFVETEIIKDDFDSYEVKKIMSNGSASGYLIKIVSENKLVFADKNERTKKVTYFDGDLGGVFVGDFSDENKGDDYTTTAWKFLGFTKKFIGGGKSCGPERDQIGTGCIKNCKKTFSILFMEFSYGDVSVEGC